MAVTLVPTSLSLSIYLSSMIDRCVTNGIYGARYSRMDQVKSVKDSLQKISGDKVLFSS